MNRIRDLLNTNPRLVLGVVLLASLLGAWRLYPMLAPQRPAPQLAAPAAQPAPPKGQAAPPAGQAAPGTPAAAPGSTAAPGGQPAPGTAGTGAGVQLVTPSAAPGTVPPSAATSEGRSDPFSPLLQPGSGAPSGTPTLPPVPPLSPGMPGLPGSVGPAVPVGPSYRVAGIIWDGQALAILEDAKGSYIVSPGDMLASGARVVSIDARRGMVTVERDGVPEQLVLQPLRTGPAAPAK